MKYKDNSVSKGKKRVISISDSREWQKWAFFDGARKAKKIPMAFLLSGYVLRRQGLKNQVGILVYSNKVSGLELVSGNQADNGQKDGLRGWRGPRTRRNAKKKKKRTQKKSVSFVELGKAEPEPPYFESAVVCLCWLLLKCSQAEAQRLEGRVMTER